MAGSDADGVVDLQAMMEEFRIDPERTTLELPKTLTADQRKEAKRLVGLFPEMKCESYGYGEERRLHVFKRQEKLKVKNTFIDGWEGEAGSSEPVAFRSMPHNMPENLLERTLQRCLGGKQEAIKETSVAEASPTASVSEAELPPLPDGFQIRNTFIHIEDVPVVERVVQSMPHGMFRQCLEAELSSQGPVAAATGSTAAPAGYAAGAAPPVAAPPMGPPSAPPTAAAPAVIASAEDENEGGVLVPGTEVIIQGLVKLPDFNGLTGVVQSLDPASGRYDVLLNCAAGQCGWRWVKVKRSNCRLCMPPPPASAPTLNMDHEEASAGKTVIPPTPKWEDGDAGIDAKSATTLKLNSLV